MSEMHIFEKAEFGKVRVVERESEPWFVAKDVCSCLELGNVGQALSYLDVDEKSSIDPNIITADVGFDAMMKDAHTPMRSVIPEAGRGGRPPQSCFRTRPLFPRSPFPQAGSQGVQTVGDS